MTALNIANAKCSLDFLNLTLGNLIFANLLPVTIGNVIGGSLLVGIFYWMIYLRGAKDSRVKKTS